MIGLEPLDPIQVFSPDVQPLLWQAGNQIDADIRESMFAKGFEVVKYVGGAVYPARILQIRIVKRMNTKADSIDAGRAVLLQFLCGQCTRIGLKADFCGACRKRMDDVMNGLAFNV